MLSETNTLAVETVQCPYCNTVWSKYRQDDDTLYFDWESDNHAYQAIGDYDHPIQNGFCYACALEKAPANVIRQFCEVKNREEFAGWIIGVYDRTLDEDAQNVIIRGKFAEYINLLEVFPVAIPTAWILLCKDFISDYGADDFRKWRLERGD